MEGIELVMADGSSRSIDTSPWLRAANKALVFSEDKGARVIGVIGDRPGVGVSLFSSELARAYARNGINALLVDASRLDSTAGLTAEGEGAPLDLLAIATPIEPGLAKVDLAQHRAALPSDRKMMVKAFEQAAAGGVAVVVDLPPVNAGTGHGAPIINFIGGSCQLVYLLCLSGVIKKVELRDSIEQCLINRIPVGGVIINDRQQPFAWLATDW